MVALTAWRMLPAPMCSEPCYRVFVPINDCDIFI